VQSITVSIVTEFEKQLPSEILQRAESRHGELAWRPADIPAVIEAARCANLVSLGGNLQIIAPWGKWCEPIGFGIDTRFPNDLPWQTQVEESAKVALAEFQALQDNFDLEAIARESHPTLVAEVDDAKEVIRLVG